MMTREQVLQDPTASYWLKDCLTTSEKRDTDDLLNDLTILNQVIKDEALNYAQLLEHKISQINRLTDLIDFETLESPDPPVDPSGIQEILVQNPEARGDVFDVAGRILSQNVKLSDINNGYVSFGSRQIVTWIGEEASVKLVSQ